MRAYLGLRTGPIGGEGVLPLRQAQVGEHQAVVGGEGGGQVVPVQRTVQEPNGTLLGYNPWGQKCNVFSFDLCWFN